MDCRLLSLILSTGWLLKVSVAMCYLFLEWGTYHYSRKLWSVPVGDAHISLYLPCIYFSWLMQIEKIRSQTLTGNLLPITRLFKAVLCFHCIVTAYTASNFENNPKLLKVSKVTTVNLYFQWGWRFDQLYSGYVIHIAIICSICFFQIPCIGLLLSMSQLPFLPFDNFLINLQLLIMMYFMFAYSSWCSM